jgi:hypothetical protein
MSKGCKRTALFGVLAVLLLCGGCALLEISPYGECLDFMSGHAPHVALEQFIRRVIGAAAAHDYDWLATVCEPQAVEALKAAQPHPLDGYTITFSDDLAGGYEYNIEFDSGLSLHLSLRSVWPECPDRDVTEQEILKYIRLEDVTSSRHRATER